MTVPPVLSPPRPAPPAGLASAALGSGLIQDLGALAVDYGAMARLADGELRAGLEALAAAKWAQREELRAVGDVGEEGGTDPVVPVRPPGPPRWGVLLGKAFEAERGLEQAAHQLAHLTSAGALAGPAARLAGEIARDRAVLRRLYLRYS